MPPHAAIGILHLPDKTCTGRWQRVGEQPVTTIPTTPTALLNYCYRKGSRQLAWSEHVGFARSLKTAAVMLLCQARYQSLADKGGKISSLREAASVRPVPDFKTPIWLAAFSLPGWSSRTSAHRVLAGRGPYAELRLTSHFCMGMLQGTIHYTYPHTPHPAALPTSIH